MTTKINTYWGGKSRPMADVVMNRWLNMIASDSGVFPALTNLTAVGGTVETIQRDTDETNYGYKLEQLIPMEGKYNGLDAPYSQMRANVVAMTPAEVEAAFVDGQPTTEWTLIESGIWRKVTIPTGMSGWGETYQSGARLLLLNAKYNVSLL